MLDHQLFEYFLSFLLAFSIAFVISPRILVMLRKLNFGQEIRQEGPQSHLSKAGTPTMGGVVFIIAIIGIVSWWGAENLNNIIIYIYIKARANIILNS